MKKSIFSKLKKALVVILVMITMFIAMPVKSNANVINEFVSLLLFIPDGIMAVIDGQIAESKEFTSRELDFKGYDEHGYIYNFKVTPYEIFTSGTYEEKDGKYITKLGYLDINFFSDREIESSTGGAVSSNILAPVIGNIYKALRDLCMVLMLLVILYIGIKIMISSIAEQQAKYKRFLMDWVVGFALLFMMHYIMSGIVNLNTIIVQMLSNDEGDSYYVAVNELQDKKADKDTGAKNSTSTWMDIVRGGVTLDEVKVDMGINFKNESEVEFKKRRLIIRNSDSETDTYASYIGSDGKIDLENVPGGNLVYNENAANGRAPNFDGEDKWGDNGVIYVSASIYNPAFLEDADEIKTKDRAIIKFNAMSYVRTISSFSSKDNDSVLLYDNGNIKATDTYDSMGYSALYLCLVIETIMFLFIYIKRVLQMAFLTMVAPIVAIMYPVDRLGDGKAQAFNQWLKDYIFNILIQPMHLLLYTVFIVAAGQLISRNIIYGLAIYGFMIPAENYFKKVLGFEKASNSGGGALAKAAGAGLAMEGLGKIAGIGPAARKGGSGSSGDGKRRLRKIGKNTPPGGPSSGGLGGGPAGSGAPGAGGTGGAGRGSNNRNGNRGNGAGSGAGGRNPGASGAPGANGNGRRGLLSRTGSALKRRAIKGLTGGSYSNLKSSDAKLVAAANAGRFVGKKIARAGGAVLGGSAGLVVGAASAMATGNASNITKGILVGGAGGRNFAGNKFDSTTGFISDFGNDLKAERANEQVEVIDPNTGESTYEYTADAKEVRMKMRAEEALKKLDDEITDLPEKEQEKYIKAIEDNAQYVSFDSIKDVKGFMELQKSGASTKDIVDMYDDAKGYDVSTHRDAYMKEQLRRLAENHEVLGTVSEARREAVIKEIMDDPSVLSSQYPGWKKMYDDATKRTKLVIAAQKKMG